MNEKKRDSEILYIHVCVCVCVDGEVDFGLRYDPQVKLNKKINKYTNNKPFVSKFRVNYGFLTNHIGSANGFFFPLFYLFEVMLSILKKKSCALCHFPNYMFFFFITSTNVIFHLNFLLFLINSLLLFL